MGTRQSGRTPAPKINSDFVYEYKGPAAAASAKKTQRILITKRRDNKLRIKAPIAKPKSVKTIVQSELPDLLSTPLSQPEDLVAVPDVPVQQMEPNSTPEIPEPLNPLNPDDDGKRPEVNLATLTARAIIAAGGVATLPDIYTYFTDINCKRNWPNSVRHQLSLNRLFHRRDKEGRGSYWIVDMVLLRENIVLDEKNRIVVVGSGLMDRNANKSGRKKLATSRRRTFRELHNEPEQPHNGELWPAESVEEPPKKRRRTKTDNRPRPSLEDVMPLDVIRRCESFVHPDEPIEPLIQRPPKTLQYKMSWEERLVNDHPNIVSELREPMVGDVEVPFYGAGCVNYGKLPEPLVPTYIDSITKASELIWESDPIYYQL